MFCLSHLLHIYALSAAGQIRQTEIGFFFSYGLGSAGTLVLPGIIICSHISMLWKDPQ